MAMHISGIKSCFSATCNGCRGSQGKKGEKDKKKSCGATPPRKDESSESFADRLAREKKRIREKQIPRHYSQAGITYFDAETQEHFSGIKRQEESDIKRMRRGENPL